MNLRIVSLSLAVLAFAAFNQSANAQSNSMFGGSSPISGGFGAGTATTGNSQSASSAFPTSNFPTTAFGSNAGAAGATGQMGGAAGQAGGANGQQAGTMVGQRNTRLAGTNATTQQGGMQNMNNRQGQNRNSTRRAGQTGNQNGQSGTGNNSQPSRVRPQMVVAFDHAKPTPVKMEAALIKRFTKLANKEKYQGIEIEVDGSKVTLRGEVASEKEVKLASILARLEPGVRSVQNELTVAAAPEPEAE